MEKKQERKPKVKKYLVIESYTCNVNGIADSGSAGDEKEIKSAFETNKKHAFKAICNIFYAIILSVFSTIIAGYIT